MGIYTYGWIEVAYVDKWVGVIKITPDVFPGLGRGELRYRLYDQAEEGFPEDLSKEAKHDKSKYHMSPGFILWSAIEQQKVDLRDIDPKRDRWWQELSDMVAILRHDHEAEQIRFVFWGS